MAKTLKQVLELYKPKAGDEQKFVAKHVVVKHDDANGNKDDVFQATNVKSVNRNSDKHGYPPGADESVYEETSQVDEKLSPSADAGEYIRDFQKSDAPQFAGKSKEKRRQMAVAAFMSSKKGMKEEAEEVDLELLDELKKETIQSYKDKVTKRSLNPLPYQPKICNPNWHEERGKVAHKNYMRAHARLTGKAPTSKPFWMKEEIEAYIKNSIAEELKDISEEQLEELKKSTLMRYMSKANKSSIGMGVKAARARDEGDMATWANNRNKAERRDRNVQRAMGKVRGEEVEQVEGEQLDELSSDTLRRYMKGARKDISKNTARLGDAPAGSKRLAKINKRVKGFRTAWAKVDAKEDVELDDTTKLLEMYANLTDENKVNFVEMYQNDRELLLSFVNGNVESEDDNV